jgi:DNA ligase 1
VKFADLVAAYDRLDATTKRTELRDILAELFRQARGEELASILFFSQGQLRPEYEGIELGVADSLARRAVAEATGVEASAVRAGQVASGDLGSTAEELLRGRSGARQGHPLTVAEVYEGFRAIADAKGEGSQDRKVGLLRGLLERAEPTEAKYIARFALGQLRLGVREMTILDALAAAFGGGEKGARAQLEAAFNLTSDLGQVAEAVSHHGLAGLAALRMEVGRPIRPMLAERATGLEDVMTRMGGRAALENKYDGLRIQAHIAGDGHVRLFSRRLEEVGAQYPELRRALPEALRRRPAIVEGECVAIDPSTDEIRAFQDVARRRGRKYDLDEASSENPVALFLFDVLLDPGGPVAPLPFGERRRRLEALIAPNDAVRIAEQRIVESVADAQAYFDQCVASGGEGIVAKSLSPESAYRAGARGFWWIKYKREYTHALADSIDGVVVGAFHGRGRRAGRYGAFLMAVYDPKADAFESFCKVGSGFDDAQLDDMRQRLRPLEATTPDPRLRTSLTPDRWVRPSLVLEIRGAELTRSPTHAAGAGTLGGGGGLALRFPRFTGRFRDDKGPTEATTTSELVRLFRSQVKTRAADDRGAAAEEPAA